MKKLWESETVDAIDVGINGVGSTEPLFSRTSISPSNGHFFCAFAGIIQNAGQNPLPKGICIRASTDGAGAEVAEASSECTAEDAESNAAAGGWSASPSAAAVGAAAGVAHDALLLAASARGCTAAAAASTSMDGRAE